MNQERPSYITIKYCSQGWYCVMMSWTNDHGGHYIVSSKSIVLHRYFSDAEEEAKDWAVMKNVNYI
jgi:hypothetical protein